VSVNERELIRAAADPSLAEEWLYETLAKLRTEDRRIAALYVAADIGWALRNPVAAFVALGSFEIAGRGYCVEGVDPVKYSDVSVVPDREALCRTFHNTLTDPFVRPVLETLQPIARISPRALWAMVSTEWAEAVELVAVVSGEQVVDTFQQLIESHDSMSTASPVFYHDEDGLAHWAGACCLIYRLPGRTYCDGACPLLPEGKTALREARRLRALKSASWDPNGLLSGARGLDDSVYRGPTAR
jgi:hypothetical protein